MTTANAVPDTPVLLTIDRITKDFPGLRALDEVSLKVKGGEITALLGQNGSGKSTLVKILAGVYTADAGTVAVHTGSGIGSRKDSLHFIHQDLGLIDNLSTVENLNLTPGSRGLFAPSARRAEYRRAQTLMRSFGIDVDVRRPIAQLSPAQRAVVAIARAMDGWTSPVNIVVLDEPTAALHGGEVEILFNAIRAVAAAGAGVVFISHRLEEVTELAHRAIVLRDGRITADVLTTGLTSGNLAELITGRVGSVVGTAAAPPVDTKAPALSVRGLTGTRVRSFDVDVGRGEIIGITGTLGSGREHVAGLIYGSTRRTGGTVTIGSRTLPNASPHSSVQHGMALVPADRRAHGGVMTLSVRENLTLPNLTPLSFARVHLRPNAERANVLNWMRQVEVRPLTPERPLGLFSGGNQQKVVLARWLRTQPEVLLIEEPTQGVDVGSSEAIRALIIAAAGRGTAVLVASSDNADLIRMCSRVLVLRDGICAAVLTGDAINDHRLTQECLGITADHLAVPT